MEIIDVPKHCEQHLWRERGKEVLALIPLNLDDHIFSGKLNRRLGEVDIILFWDSDNVDLFMNVRLRRPPG